ncbi:hypothetical protein B0H13DRAFT_1869325 [Mycena leptocephala]|nr:hypothetical protein B0H13DRAFT_1869325 [Mycena leptocephala]
MLVMLGCALTAVVAQWQRAQRASDWRRGGWERGWRSRCEAQAAGTVAAKTVGVPAAFGGLGIKMRKEGLVEGGRRGVRVRGTDTMGAVIELVLVVEAVNSAWGAPTHKVGQNVGEGGSKVGVALRLSGTMGSEGDVLPGGVVGIASVVH